MVDASNLYRGSYINVDLVENSDNKIAVIIGAGKVETNEWQKQRLVVPVELNGDQYDWSLNRDSWDNLSREYGNETKKWLSKKVYFSVEKAANGKDMVVGRPTNKDLDTIEENV